MDGRWRQVNDENGSHVGYQIVVKLKADQDISGGVSPCSITECECQLNAGLGGESRTLVGSDLLSRFRRTKDGATPVPAEDAIERALVKVAVWPYPASRIDDGKGTPVYGDRAPRAYPKPAFA